MTTAPLYLSSDWHTLNAYATFIHPTFFKTTQYDSVQILILQFSFNFSFKGFLSMRRLINYYLFNFWFSILFYVSILQISKIQIPDLPSTSNLQYLIFQFSKHFQFPIFFFELPIFFQTSNFEFFYFQISKFIFNFPIFPIFLFWIIKHCSTFLLSVSPKFDHTIRTPYSSLEIKVFPELFWTLFLFCSFTLEFIYFWLWTYKSYQVHYFFWCLIK